MPFVKIDTGILRSTVWYDPEACDVFLTTLLLAEPFELKEPAAQLEVRSLDPTGWTAPPGWYGLARAAGVGIVRQSHVADVEKGLQALERLGAPDSESRSKDFEGRRLVRIDGGYLVLNYDRYRERDYTAAERMRRYRSRHTTRDTPTVTRNVTSRTRHVTQAEAEVEAEEEKTLLSGTSSRSPRIVGSDEPTPPPAEPNPKHQAKMAHREELDWRVGVVWKSYLAERRAFFTEENGSPPSIDPALTPEIRKAIAAGLETHDKTFLGAGEEAREEWAKRSSVRAAGIGIFLSPWHTGKDKDNDATNGGKRYLEPWRPWKHQRGKPDPIPTFAALYFEAKEAPL